MEGTVLQLAEPFLQWGFAGFSVLLLAALVWMASRFVKVLLENNRVIERNTAAITAVSKRTDDELVLIREMRDHVVPMANKVRSLRCVAGED